MRQDKDILSTERNGQSGGRERRERLEKVERTTLENEKRGRSRGEEVESLTAIFPKSFSLF